MTQEEKQLLLQDLCARLPYEVRCNVKYIINNETTHGEDVESECIDIIKRINFDAYSVYTEWLGYESDIENIKPYLRPMSSMTEEEAKELYTLLFKVERLGIPDLYKEHNAVSLLYDWLNANYFDYRGLIEKNLALDCTGLHIYD